MSTLTVRFIDGSTLPLDVRPETTIAELRAQIARSIPVLHEVRLLELHAVVVKSAEDIADNNYAKWASFFKRVGHRGDFSEWFACRRECFASFDEAPDLDLLTGERLREKMLGFDGFEMHLDSPEEFGLLFAGAFGRKCGDPTPHLERLRYLCLQERPRDFYQCERAFIALVEIGKRCPDAIDDFLRSRMVERAVDDVAQMTARIFWVFEICAVASCFVLSHFGNAVHEAALFGLKELTRPGQPGMRTTPQIFGKEENARVHQAAEDCLQHLRKRLADSSNVDDAPPAKRRRSRSPV